MTKDRFRKAFLLVLVISVTAVFLVMLRSFLVTILMAAIFSGLLYPSYRGSRRPASQPGARGDRDRAVHARARDCAAPARARAGRESGGAA